MKLLVKCPLILTLAISLFYFSCPTLYAQWTLKDGPYGGTITALFPDGSRLFAGTQGNNIYYSDNMGSSWQSAGGPALYVSSFCRSGESLLAAAHDMGIYKSTNQGLSWEQSGLNINEVVYSLLTIGEDVYAGTNSGVYRSSDNGGHWELIFQSVSVTSLIQKGNSIFAVTYFGIYISEDYGSHWTLLDNSGTGITSIVAAGENLFKGNQAGTVHKSIDNGTSWTDVNFPYSLSITVIFFSNDVLYVGNGGGGIYASSDEGETWSPLSNGLYSFHIVTLAEVDGNLFAGTFSAGVFKSTNHGVQWEVSNNGLSCGRIYALMKTPDNAIYASSFGNGISKSVNGGETFPPVNETTLGRFAGCFAQAGDYLFAGMLSSGVVRSHNAGNTWEYPINTIYNQSVTGLTIMGTKLYAGTLSGDVFVSENNATTWSAVSNGLPDNRIQAISNDGTNLFVGTYGGGVYISSDQGLNWEAVNAGITNLNITCLTIKNNTLYAGTENGLFKSTNQGNSWTSIGSGLVNPSIRAIEVTDEFIFTGTYDALNITSVSVISWDRISLPNRYAEIKSFLPHNGELLVGTSSGLYSLAIPNFPRIDSIEPSAGYVGETVTITGDNLGAAGSVVSVSFNGAEATISNSSQTSITVTVPNGATTGRISVTIDGKTKSSSSNFIVYVVDAPVATAATNVKATEFQANWNSVSGISNYRLDVSADHFVSYVPGYKSKLISSTSALVSGLNPNIVYEYRVQSVSSGLSNYSNTISCTTLKLLQSINFNPLQSVPENLGSINLSDYASTDSGLDIVFTSSNTSVGVISDNIIHIVGPGVTEITASQPGNSEYEPAVSIKKILEVFSKVMSFSSEAIVQDTLHFGVSALGDVTDITISIKNTGTAPLQVSRINYPAEFTGDVSSTLIPAGESKDLTIAFVPFQEGKVSGEIIFDSDATSGPVRLIASGTSALIAGLERDNTAFSIYPNPGNGQFYIKFKSDILDIDDIQIMNAMGKTINYSSRFDSGTGELSIDFTQEAPGLYLLSASGKIIKLLKQ